MFTLSIHRPFDDVQTGSTFPGGDPGTSAIADANGRLHVDGWCGVGGYNERWASVSGAVVGEPTPEAGKTTLRLSDPRKSSYASPQSTNPTPRAFRNEAIRPILGPEQAFRRRAARHATLPKVASVQISALV